MPHITRPRRGIGFQPMSSQRPERLPWLFGSTWAGRPCHTAARLLPLLAALLAGPAAANIITISPANNLQAAINSAANGDVIRFMPGTYIQTAVINGKSLRLEGINGAAATTLSATGLGDTALRINNAPSPGVTIRGLTIRGGSAPGDSSGSQGYPNDGGGISASASRLTIDDCRFFSNTAAHDGGAISSVGGQAMTITDSTFQSDTAGLLSKGGGVFSLGPTTIQRCTFTQETALHGGAVYLGPGAGGSVEHSTFTQNLAQDSSGASGEGGALDIAVNNGVSVSVSDCDFTGNFTAASGGAIYAPSGSLVIERSTFTENQTALSVFFTNSAGGVFAGSTLTVRDCTFVRNSSQGDGGGLIGLGTLTIERSSFLGNTATGGDGGGLGAGGETHLSNCVFVANHAVHRSLSTLNFGGLGGAVLAGHDAGVPFQVTNCTFAINEGVEPVISGTNPTTLTNCIVTTVESAVISPQHAFTYSLVSGFGPLRSGIGNINQPPHFTVEPLPSIFNYGDLHLLPDSPAIDAGDSTAAFALPTDRDGNGRNADDPATPNSGVSTWGLNVDMGAFELQPPPPQPACPADFNNSGSVSVQDIFDFLAAYFAGCP